jgi:cytochrome c oxidase assembly protein subunit 15
MIGFILMIVQIVLGTQVREEIDQIASAMGNLMRGSWIESIGLTFLIHRSYSLLLFVIHILFIYKIYKYSVRRSGIFKLSQLLIIVIVFEILTGVGMAYFAIPAFLQPIHLLSGSLIIGIQFLLLLNLQDQKKITIEN